MLSTFTWISILVIAIIIKHIIIEPKEDKQLFELYEIRDRISIAAMNREIDQKSIEYEFVVENINFWIYNTKNNYNFANVIKNVFLVSKIGEKPIENLIDNIKQQELLREGFNKISIHKSRIMRIKGVLFCSIISFILEMALSCVNVFFKVSKMGYSTQKYLSNKLHESKKIKNTYEYTSDILCKRI